MSQPSAATPVTLLLRGTELDGEAVDVAIAGPRIAEIAPHDPARRAPEGTRVLEAAGTALLPGLVNAHTHTAMTMMRGYADDMPLMPWLQEKIWPLERGLTDEDVYWGTRLGCLDMIRTGTTTFNDMYWHFDATARAARDSGMRAQLAPALIDGGDPTVGAGLRADYLACADRVADYGPRVRFALGPHAIYTVSEDTLRWVADASEARDLPVHIHVAETEGEVRDCLAAQGLRPVAYLDRLGLVGPRLLLAHAVHLEEQEIDRLAEAGAHALHNPVSNLKLASGGPMPYRAMRRAGLNVAIGTDGCASNNSLDLLEDLKFAALLAKHATGDPTALPAAEALELATRNGARALRLEAGVVVEGALADLVLVDLAHPFLFPGNDLAADLVYSAQGRCVHTTICHGEVLMEDGVIADEAEIRAEVAARWARLTASA